MLGPITSRIQNKEVYATLCLQATASQGAITRLQDTDEPSVAFIFLFLGLDISQMPEGERDNSSHNRWLYPGTGFTQAEKDIDAGEPWEVPMYQAFGTGYSLFFYHISVYMR